MNKQIQRNNVIRLLDHTKRHNYFGNNGFNTGNTKEHEHKKLDIAWEHHLRGHSVILEAPFAENKGQADVLCLDCETCYEVANSETEESLENKKRKYPESLSIEVVRVKGTTK